MLIYKKLNNFISITLKDSLETATNLNTFCSATQRDNLFNVNDKNTVKKIRKITNESVTLFLIISGIPFWLVLAFSVKSQNRKIDL